MPPTRKAQTEEFARAMAERNAHRAEIVKRIMGQKYACHPANRVQRRDHDLRSIYLSVVAEGLRC